MGVQDEFFKKAAQNEAALARAERASAAAKAEQEANASRTAQLIRTPNNAIILAPQAISVEQSGSAERILWRGKPSQWVNFDTYVLCTVFSLLIVPIFIAIWKWMEVKAMSYELTSQRFTYTSGVFNKTTREVELYRVRDSMIHEPFFLRMFGLGNVFVNANDKSSPRIGVMAIQMPEAFRQCLRNAVEKVREQKGVKAIEV